MDNLPLAADMTQSRAIAAHAFRALDNALSRARSDFPGLDLGVVTGEFLKAARRWLAIHDTFPGPYREGDVLEMDSGALQTLAMEIDAELEARGYSVTRSVAPPGLRLEPDAREEFATFAIGTGVHGEVKP